MKALFGLEIVNARVGDHLHGNVTFKGMATGSPPPNHEAESPVCRGAIHASWFHETVVEAGNVDTDRD